MKNLELHLKVSQQKTTAIDYISANASLSKNLIKKVMSCGAVWLERNNSTKRIRRATKQVFDKDQIHLYYNKEIIDIKPLESTLIVDKEDYSVWNKPAGIFSQGTKYGDHCTVQRYAEKTLIPQRNAFIVHRLDRDANGLIIIAHSKTAAVLFSALFKKHQINKTYQIIVQGNLSINHLPHKISQPIDGKDAISIIEQLNYQVELNQTKVQINIKTGRKHQIRKHMADLGHPIVGDILYGKISAEKISKIADENIREKLQLSAWRLEFICPITHQPQIFQLNANI